VGPGQKRARRGPTIWECRLELRFGLVDGCSGASEEVGRQFVVTRERIRQIESKALRNMGILADFRHLEGLLEVGG